MVHSKLFDFVWIGQGNPPTSDERLELKIGVGFYPDPTFMYCHRNLVILWLQTMAVLLGDACGHHSYIAMHVCH